jgi:5-methylcytosine-specific restriction protein A
METNEVDEFEQERSDGTVVAKKREAELTKEFCAYFEAKGHEVKRYRLTILSSVSPLFTDEFDLTDGILYEAKSSASRQAIRTAIGQLYDYRWYIDQDDVSLSVLVPTRPCVDMVDLLTSLGISCVVRNGRNDFATV